MTVKILIPTSLQKYTNDQAALEYDVDTIDTLISVIANTSRNNLNNSVNPTSGNKLKLGSEQFVPLGENSPTFNRVNASYAFFMMCGAVGFFSSFAFIDYIR